MTDGKRYPRPATQTDVEAVRGRVSDAKTLFRGEVGNVKDRLNKVEGVVEYLAEARKDDIVHRRWLIGLGLIISASVIGQSFASCIYTRESVAELKAEISNIKGRQ